LFLLELYHTLVFLSWNKQFLAFVFGVDVVGFLCRIAGVRVSRGARMDAFGFVGDFMSFDTVPRFQINPDLSGKTRY